MGEALDRTLDEVLDGTLDEALDEALNEAPNEIFTVWGIINIDQISWGFHFKFGVHLATKIQLCSGNP
jgi:hypothetical protein